MAISAHLHNERRANDIRKPAECMSPKKVTKLPNIRCEISLRIRMLKIPQDNVLRPATNTRHVAIDINLLTLS